MHGLFGTPFGGWRAQDRHYARVTHTATQSLTSGAYLTLTWNTITDNPSGLFTISQPTRLTAMASDLYLIGASWKVAASATGDRYGQFLRNGVVSITTLPEWTQKSATAEHGMSMSHSMWLDAGDYIEVQAKQDSGGALNVTVAVAQPQFWLVRL